MLTNDTELKIKIHQLVDAQNEDSLQEVYDWLSAKLKVKEFTFSLEQGYREMAKDTEREKQAFEWIEGAANYKEL